MVRECNHSINLLCRYDVAYFTPKNGYDLTLYRCPSCYAWCRILKREILPAGNLGLILREGMGDRTLVDEIREVIEAIIL